MMVRMRVRVRVSFLDFFLTTLSISTMLYVHVPIQELSDEIVKKVRVLRPFRCVGQTKRFCLFHLSFRVGVRVRVRVG